MEVELTDLARSGSFRGCPECPNCGTACGELSDSQAADSIVPQPHSEPVTTGSAFLPGPSRAAEGPLACIIAETGFGPEVPVGPKWSGEAGGRMQRCRLD